MADHPKATWPKTPDGTTDWEVVFEDPSIGFISLIKRAHTKDAIEKTTTVILKKLFSRRNDLDLYQQNIHRLKTILTNHADNLSGIHEDVSVLLREVKNERIKLARDFVDRKAAGAAIDRRSGLFWNTSGVFQLKILLPLVGLIIAIIAGAFYLMMGTNDGGSSIHAAKFGQTKSTYKRSYDSVPTESANIMGTPEAPPKPANVAVLLKVIKWPLISTNARFKPAFFSVILYVQDTETAASVCARVPSMSDRIMVAFSNALPQDRTARIDEISTAEREIRDLLNGMFGNEYVDRAALARYGTSGFKAASQRPFCKFSNPE
ncbi:MAG: hypothetical protein JKY92_07810 [Magnetovibrio sp.]|nr:hypothetical protein [Magnetovibrio sp.]